MRTVVALSAVLLLTALSGPAFADTTVDLTTEDAEGTANDAIFVQIDPQSVGTGVIDSFLRVQANGDEEGFNTDYTPPPLDAKAGNFTESLTLGEVPIVEIDGTDYRQFLLDINEVNSNETTTLLTMHQVELWMHDAGETSLSTLSDVQGGGSHSDAELVWELDGDGDNEVILKYGLNAGSGEGDMFMYVPDELFDNWGDDDQVYLYSVFGPDYDSDDGFEEWAVLKPEGTPDDDPPIPEPSTFALLALAAGGALALRRRRKA